MDGSTNETAFTEGKEPAQTGLGSPIWWMVTGQWMI
jgi:hypothetical protein